jgi:hypothetical protein
MSFIVALWRQDPLFEEMVRTASGYIQKLVWHWQNNPVTRWGQHPSAGKASALGLPYRLVIE